jgi:putative transposase
LSFRKVEDDSYLMTVARYIHQNPVKTGLVTKAKNYHWSSYPQYIDAYNGRAVYIDTERIRDYFNSRREFEEFMELQQDGENLRYQTMDRIADGKLAEIIQQNYGVKLGEIITREKRNLLIQQLYKRERTSIRQLARVLGVGKGVAERALDN